MCLPFHVAHSYGDSLFFKDLHEPCIVEAIVRSWRAFLSKSTFIHQSRRQRVINGGRRILFLNKKNRKYFITFVMYFFNNMKLPDFFSFSLHQFSQGEKWFASRELSHLVWHWACSQHPASELLPVDHQCP